MDIGTGLSGVHPDYQIEIPVPDVPELKRLHCSPDIYHAGMEWLHLLDSLVVGAQECHTERFGGVTSMHTHSIRPLTSLELAKVFKLIKKLDLIVEQRPHGMMCGIQYQLYSNPQADRLVEGLPARGGAPKPVKVFLLLSRHFDGLSLPDIGTEGSSDSRITAIYDLMRLYSHSSANLAWLQHYGLYRPSEVSSCLY